MPTSRQTSRQPSSQRSQSAKPRKSSSESQHQKARKQILESLDVTLPRSPATMGYRIALATVAFAMLILPLLYFGFIGLLLYTCWWTTVHGMNNDAPWSFVACGFALLTIIALVKPIFVSDPEYIRPSRLKREAEPFLFEYVEAICEAVNAPVPEEIRLDCEANASASLMNGPLSIFSKNLTLTVGLPLAAGLNVREFTGVLAHEFGHFSQGYGMRASGLIRSTNYWFFKAAYSRDRWDYYLMKLSHSLPSRIGVFVYAARLLIWLSRCFIAFVAIISHGMSCVLLRHMEFDADRYETGLVGTKAFRSTSRKLRPLGLAQQMSLNDAQAFYDEGRLADEFPKLVVSNVRRLDQKLLKRIRKAEDEEKTGWFDSHPSNRDRVAASEAMDTSGVIALSPEVSSMPASVLFQNFRAVSKGATARLYRRILGEQFDKSTLRPSDVLIKRREAEYEASKSVERYFQVHIPVLRPLRISDDVMKPPEKPSASARELMHWRSEMAKQVDEYEVLCEALVEAEKSWLKAAAARTLLDSEVKFDHRTLNVRSRKKSDIAARLKQTDTAVKNLSLQMIPFEDAAEQRLSIALQLLRVPKAVERMPGGAELAATTAQLIPDARLIASLMSEVPDVRLTHIKLMSLFSHLDQNQSQPALYHQIELQVRELYNTLRKLLKKLKDRTYPFDHANDTLTLASFVVPQMPEDTDIGGLIDASQYAIERLAELQVRLFAKLTFAAESVETAIGIPLQKPRKSQADGD